MNFSNKIGHILADLVHDSKKEFKYKLHKWKNKLIFLDKLFYILAIALTGLFEPNLVIIFVYFLLYPYLIFTARKSAFYHLYVSTAVALIWVLIANDQYGYNYEMITIFGLNSYPLFAWAAGLFASYLIYSHWEHKFKFVSPIKKMLLFVAFYWPILLAVETVAFHIFSIKNIAAATYPGLPFCDCIHAPLWMQISYFALGPIYFGICEWLGLENPHHIKTNAK